MKPVRLDIADLFCGAGGTTAGAIEAVQKLGFAVRVTAINHWQIAIATHSQNHPDARHLCASLDSVNPRDLFDQGELGGLLASPECMGHSNALGGKPVNDQSRATAWCVLRWLDALLPPFGLIENVPEFVNWAPLGSNNRPLKSRKGEVFQKWLNAIRSLGYKVDYRILCAADYGDPTTRRRLFVQAVRGRRKIIWPHPTHSPAMKPGLFTTRQWVPARRIIDWTLKGKSIFGRKRPLSPKTMARILEGAEKFWPEPFVVALRGTSQQQINGCSRSINEPVPTVAGGGNHLAIAEPLIVCMENGGRVLSASQPLPTITTAKGGAMAVAEPFLIHVNHGDGENGTRKSLSIDAPVPAVCGNRGELAMIEPLILPQHGGGIVRPVGEPIPTIATSGAVALIEPLIVNYYGTGIAHRVSEPVPTVTAKDRFGLARPVLTWNGKQCELDVLFRMLQPSELAGAQGFPASYRFTGNKTQVVRQIGNAVPRRLARALVGAIVGQNPDVSALLDDDLDSAKGAA